MRLRDTTTKTIVDQQWTLDAQDENAWHEGIHVTVSAFMICAVFLLSAIVSCVAKGGLV